MPSYPMQSPNGTNREGFYLPWPSQPVTMAMDSNFTARVRARDHRIAAPRSPSFTGRDQTDPDNGTVYNSAAEQAHARLHQHAKASMAPDDYSKFCELVDQLLDATNPDNNNGVGDQVGGPPAFKGQPAMDAARRTRQVQSSMQRLRAMFPEAKPRVIG